MKWLKHFIDAVVWGSILAVISRLPRPEPRRDRIRRTWKQRLLEAGVLFGTLALLGFGMVIAGLIPVKASSGHLPPVRWFLEFAMARGFSTQSMMVKVPKDLDRAANVLKGAGQYETTCRPCHGSPELKRPRVAAAMTPHPPYLGDAVTLWSEKELFSIVKHGVKFTGMPAWPSNHRDDEVWAMVAFLKLLPSMDQREYRRLAFGEVRESSAAAPIEDLTGPENLPGAVRERCARCHGTDGRGRGVGAFPKLAGQHEEYLYNSLRAYERRTRHSGIMEPVAAGLSDAEMRELARFYSNLPSAVGLRHETATGIENGRRIAHYGIPSKKIPPCVECHGPTHPHPRGAFPMLAGQYADYIVLQLELFKKGHRGGSSWAHLMEEVAPKLSEQEMRDVAAYYASLE
jgi:cytochrome c553